MGLFIPLVPDVQGKEEEIDGVTYRTLRRNASDALLVAVSSPFTPTSTGSGQLDVDPAGTRVQLPSQACKAVTIAAKPGNSDNIYLGGSDVDDTNGRILEPGDAVDVAIDNLNRLYIDADTADDGISYLWVS